MLESASQNVRLWQAFERCLELDTADRDSFLAEFEKSEPEVAAGVRRLLARDETGDGFLGATLPERIGTPPERLGPYRLLSKIGSGGNGVVYRAERVEGQPTYPVAVKILRRAWNPGDAARLAEERDLLGMLDHPGICRLLASGETAGGSPWLAMELIEGRPIDQHCRSLRLPLKGRLELYRRILGAVEYLHSRSLIHCDIKPSNILVDSHGIPKLVDFGISGRCDDGERCSALAWTPGYSSPEQARGERLGPTSDIYSLGALLFQLLCDRSPAEMEGASRERSAGREGRRTEARLTPSLVVAQHRGAVISAARLRGDLDAVVRKATAERAEDRYLSVSRLAQDIDRVLGGYPVRARDASQLEHLVLALRRHRVAAGVGLLLTATSMVLGWQSQRMAAARDRAESERRRVVAASHLLTDSLADLDPSIVPVPTGEVSARRLADLARVRIEQADLDDVTRAELLRSVGSLYGGLGAYPEAVEVLQHALDLHASGPAEERAALLESLAVAKIQGTAYADAEELARRALAIRRAEPADGELLSAVSTLAWAVLRNSRNQEERLAEAERLARESLDLAAEDSLTGIELARLERLVATILQQRGAFEEAQHFAQRSLDHIERDSSATAYERALTENQIAVGEESLGHFLAAAERFRSVHGQLEAILGRHPEVAGALNNVGSSLAASGDFDQASRVLLDALALYEETLGADHIMVLNCASNAAHALQWAGDLEGAEVLHRRVAAGLEAALGDNHEFVSLAWAFVAENLALQGRNREAEAVLKSKADDLKLLEGSWMALSLASIAAFVEGQRAPSVETESELQRTWHQLDDRLGPFMGATEDARRRLERYRHRWSEQGP